MEFRTDRRSALKAAAALAVACALPARAQAKATLRFAAVFSDKDIRAGMIQMFAKEVEGDFKVEPFYNATLFKQGTELVALQRDNLELGNIAPQDISKSSPRRTCSATPITSPVSGRATSAPSTRSRPRSR